MNILKKLLYCSLDEHELIFIFRQLEPSPTCGEFINKLHRLLLCSKAIPKNIMGNFANTIIFITRIQQILLKSWEYDIKCERFVISYFITRTKI